MAISASLTTGQFVETYPRGKNRDIKVCVNQQKAPMQTSTFPRNVNCKTVEEKKCKKEKEKSGHKEL